MKGFIAGGIGLCFLWSVIPAFAQTLEAESNKGKAIVTEMKGVQIDKQGRISRFTKTIHSKKVRSIVCGDNGPGGDRIRQVSLYADGYGGYIADYLDIPTRPMFIVRPLVKRITKYHVGLQCAFDGEEPRIFVCENHRYPGTAVYGEREISSGIAFVGWPTRRDIARLSVSFYAGFAYDPKAPRMDFDMDRCAARLD
ncbi:MAG: hypothetical protein HY551_02940 [Elusimicrobia bacterium]|nr:hypothetical protein [Elusimicrobiota bacterium]